MYMVFDTETTSLPKCMFKDWDGCRLVQIGWLIIDTSYNIIDSKSYLIASTDYNTSPEALAIHNITDEYRNENGISFHDMMKHFTDDASKCKGFICHSAYFDIGVLLHECKLNDHNIDWTSNKSVFDTKLSYHYNRHRNLKTNVIMLNPDFNLKLDIKEHDALYDSYLCLELFKHTNKKITMSRNIDHIIKSTYK